MATRYTISVLAYQNLPLTRRCLESLFANSKDWELILTDNGCKDGTAEYFREVKNRYPERVTVRTYATNTGFINPNREAFAIAKGKFFVLLNNDTAVPAGWLEALEAPFLSDPLCALSGPAGNCCQLRNDFHGEIGQRFEYLEGSCLMMDRDKIAAIEPNLFPEDLIGAYGEDSYLSLRCRESGFNLARVPLAIHHARASTSVMVPQVREWQAHNHAFLQNRFRKYMIGHRFDYPIILKRNAAWGDVLLMTPVIRALKKKHGVATIQVETICPDVFNGNPDIAYVGRSITTTARDAETHNLNGISEMKPGLHIVDAYAECVGLRGGEYDRVTRLFIPQGDREWAQRCVGVESWVAVHPGPTSWPCKNWPFDRWSEVIAAIRALGFKVALVGNDSLPRYPDADWDYRKKTNVGQLGALLHECRLFVGVDSFPIHAAQAVGTPVVGLFGITNPKLILTDGSPWRAACSAPDHPATGLRHKRAGLTRVDHPSNPMETITAASVIDKVTELLQCQTTNQEFRASSR
jgi:ADP-heptose:LPS heptosyltransferase